MTRRTRGHRSGAAVMVALIALTVAGLISVGMLRLALHRRQQLQVFEHRAQVEWLLASARQRAVARLSADTTYTGESWEAIPKQATVAIRIEPIADQPRRRRVYLTAQLTTGSREIRRSRQADLRLPNPGDSP